MITNVRRPGSPPPTTSITLILTVLSSTAAATPAPRETPESPESPPTYAEFLDAFWADAWGVPFARAHSSAIVGAEGPVWVVFALDTRQTDPHAGSATFAVDGRFEIGGDPFKTVVAGSFATATMSEPVVAVADTTLLDPTSAAPIEATIFVPIARVSSIGRARYWAEVLAEALGPPEHPVEPTPAPSPCAVSHAICLAAARNIFRADLLTCRGQAGGCVIACSILSGTCLFLGSPAAPRICAVVCVAACKYIQCQCVGAAAFRYRAASLRCHGARMACEPGWLPPYYQW